MTLSYEVMEDRNSACGVGFFFSSRRRHTRLQGDWSSDVCSSDRGVYNSGILADPKTGAKYNYRDAPDALVDRARRIAAVCERHGVPLRAAAVQFPLGHPAVHTVLVGSRTSEEVEDSVRNFETPIPPELWADLKRGRLL